MKYQAPELTALSPAIKAIQSLGCKSQSMPWESSLDHREAVCAYEEWE